MSWQRAWAVVSTDEGAALILQHTARGWRAVQNSGHSALTDVVVLSRRNVWAVGKRPRKAFQRVQMGDAIDAAGRWVDLSAIGPVPGTRHWWAVGTREATGVPPLSTSMVAASL